MEYKIVEDSSNYVDTAVDSTQRLVAQAILDGWKPVGGIGVLASTSRQWDGYNDITVDVYWVMQAMTRGD